MNRRVLTTSLLIAIVLSVLVVAVWAEQPPRKPLSQGEEAAACAACGTLAGGAILIPILIFALNIALLVWVARDAKARGMDSSVLWMILVMWACPGLVDS